LFPSEVNTGNMMAITGADFSKVSGFVKKNRFGLTLGE
jgi:hypothetical protein